MNEYFIKSIVLVFDVVIVMEATIILGYRIKKKVFYFIPLLVGAFSLPMLPEFFVAHMFFLVFETIVLVIIYDYSVKDSLLKIGTCYVVVLCVEELVEMIFGFVIHENNYLLSLVSELTMVIIGTVYCCVGVKKRTKNTVSKREKYIVVFIGIVLLLLTTSLKYTQSFVLNQRFYYLTIIISMMGYLGILFSVLFFKRVDELNAELNSSIRTYREIEMAEKTMYQIRIAHEEKTKKYRHDMTNHLVMISSYLLHDRYSDAKEYIDQLLDDFGSKKLNMLNTGNDIIDSLNYYYLHDANNKGVKVSINGVVPESFPTSDLKLSSLYGNLLANAVEEQDRLEDKDEKHIWITYKYGNANIMILVENTCRTDNDYKRTSKADKELHGLGINIIKEIVEEINGTVEVNSHGLFSVKIILPRDK